MEKQSIQQVQDELQQVSHQRKAAEEKFEHLQLQLTKIQTDMEENLDSLQKLKDQESILQNKVYQLQKESLKEALSFNGVKSLLSGASPLLQKIKEKGKELKDVFENSNFDKQWLDEQYDKYRDLCIKKGEEIKSKEEFQKVALTLKKLEKEGEDFSFSELLSKASKGVGNVGNTLKEAIKNMKTEGIDKVLSSKPEDISLPQTKQEALLQWVAERKITKASLNKANSELYEDYTTYLNWVFENQIPEDILYSSKGGSFINALKKQFESSHSKKHRI